MIFLVEEGSNIIKQYFHWPIIKYTSLNYSNFYLIFVCVFILLVFIKYLMKIYCIICTHKIYNQIIILCKSVFNEYVHVTFRLTEYSKLDYQYNGLNYALRCDIIFLLQAKFALFSHQKLEIRSWSAFLHVWFPWQRKFWVVCQTSITVILHSTACQLLLIKSIVPKTNNYEWLKSFF